MNNVDLKFIIKTKSVELFSQKGFHGTTMRNIASAAKCSLPVLYYYYEDKQKLFEEVVLDEFKKIMEKLSVQTDFSLHPIDFFVSMIKIRSDLTPFDKSVYKLGLKVWMGFEGNEKARTQILDWEISRRSSYRKMFAAYVKDKIICEDTLGILINFLENIINRIILFDEVFDESKLRRSITLFFNQAHW